MDQDKHLIQYKSKKMKLAKLINDYKHTQNYKFEIEF